MYCYLVDEDPFRTPFKSTLLAFGVHIGGNHKRRLYVRHRKLISFLGPA